MTDTLGLGNRRGRRVEAVVDLRSLKKADPSILALLIKSLETGWTTGPEKAAIGRLRAL